MSDDETRPTFSEELFKLHHVDLTAQIPIHERGYLADAREHTHKLGIWLHAEIFSKQPERITYQPSARLVRRWLGPRSWWQRLKLRRGLGWIRCFSEVKLKLEVVRFQPPRVDITGAVFYPGAAVQKHQSMGRPVMHFDQLEEYQGKGVEVEYVPSYKRAVWLSESTMARLVRFGLDYLTDQRNSIYVPF